MAWKLVDYNNGISMEGAGHMWAVLPGDGCKIDMYESRIMRIRMI
jgi:hypothetical protein